MNEFITIEETLKELAQGRMVVLVDDEHRENEGDILIAAEKVTPDAINFMATYARGQICLAISNDIAERLQLPLMPERNKLPNQAPFAASIEAVRGVTTGISTFDRAHTIKVAIDPRSTPDDISLPGHIFPVIARKGGILERLGHTEGSVDLSRLAGLQPAAVICEIMNNDGTMARLEDLSVFSQKHDIKLVRVNDLVTYRLTKECNVTEVASAPLPLKNSQHFTVKIFQDGYTNEEHIALVHGSIDTSKPVLVRIHSECMTGEVFGSLRCDCGKQLQEAQLQIAQQNGIILYMRQEGRGIGLANKIKSYKLQAEGLDTVEANEKLGFLADHRSYGLCAQMLRYLGITQIRLMTNNPNKIQEIERFGIQVIERIPLETLPCVENKSYLKTKRDKLGHLLNLED